MLQVLLITCGFCVELFQDEVNIRSVKISLQNRVFPEDLIVTKLNETMGADI